MATDIIDALWSEMFEVISGPYYHYNWDGCHDNKYVNFLRKSRPYISCDYIKLLSTPVIIKFVNHGDWVDVSVHRDGSSYCYVGVILKRYDDIIFGYRSVTNIFSTNLPSQFRVGLPMPIPVTFSLTSVLSDPDFCIDLFVDFILVRCVLTMVIDNRVDMVFAKRRLRRGMVMSG
jgi:hypothetical protein